MLNLMQCRMYFFLTERLTQPQVSAKIARKLGCRGRWEGAMFVSVSREASECRLYAEHCSDKARLQSDPQLRQCFLEMQRRWLSLARSYEFAERLEFLSAVEERNKEARLIIKDADLLIRDRRFPPPWSVEETDACFIVKDHAGQ
jgi:hypothetical protein